MSAIFDNANTFTINRFANTHQAISNSGIVRTQRSSPTFYYVSAQLPPMYDERYREITTELISVDDGLLTLSTTIPSSHTYYNGTWTGTPLVQSTTGRTVTFSGFTANTAVAVASDWIQFSGSTKVYQVAVDAFSNGSGAATITLNQAPVQALSAATIVTRGADVVFKLLLSEAPAVQTVPGANGVPLYQYSGAFTFREVR